VGDGRTPNISSHNLHRYPDYGRGRGVTTPRRQDIILRWIVAATATLCAITLIVAAASLPLLVDTRDSVDASRRAEAAAACRSEVASDLHLASAVVDNVILEGLYAVAVGDGELMEQVIERGMLARAGRDAAAERVREAADLSANDPDYLVDVWCD